MKISDKALDTILDNDLMKEIEELTSNHDELIRTLAQAVLNGRLGNNEERVKKLGKYADEVQQKVNWAIQAAEDVWAGKYGTGDARREALGDDYDLVMDRVNATAKITVPGNLKYTTDMSGKRYVLKNVPAKGGKITWYGYNQHKQGDNPYVFDGSGCGFMSFYAVISTIKKYNELPLAYAKKNLTAVTGAKKCPISIWAGCKLLDHENIKYTWIKGTRTTQQIYDDIKAHLQTGQPVIVSLYKDNRAGKEDKRYTRYAHYSLLIGVTADGKSGYLLDSGSKLPRYVDLWDICDHIPCTKANPDYDPIWNGWKNAGGYVKVRM